MGHFSRIFTALLTIISISLAATSANNGETAFPDYNTSAQPSDQSGMKSTASDLANRMHLGWNLGNALEASDGETGWGNPKTTKKLITLVKKSGFKAVRLPVAWDQYADPNTAEISDAWIRRVKEVVDYCLDNDLYVVLNIHWDGGWLENNIEPTHADAINARQRAYWQQIATAFRQYDERLLFAGANEPDVETPEQMAILDRFHQTFVTAVRETGGKNSWRTLIVQGPRTDFEKTFRLWNNMPVDTVPKRLMMEVHFYTPYNFALMAEDQDWGKQFYYWGKDAPKTLTPGRAADWANEDGIQKLFDLMEQKFTTRGIPVILGEYGAINRSSLKGEELVQHKNSRNAYLKFVTREAVKRGMVPFYWDNGSTDNNGMALFNRDKNELFDQGALLHILEGAKR